jgi:hypothetical protein
MKIFFKSDDFGRLSKFVFLQPAINSRHFLQSVVFAMALHFSSDSISAYPKRELVSESKKIL